jgi:hypothetical protein
MNTRTATQPTILLLLQLLLLESIKDFGPLW